MELLIAEATLDPARSQRRRRCRWGGEHRDGGPREVDRGERNCEGLIAHNGFLLVIDQV